MTSTFPCPARLARTRNLTLVALGIALLVGCRSTEVTPPPATLSPAATESPAGPAFPVGRSEQSMTAMVDGHQLDYLLDVPLADSPSDNTPPDDGWPLLLFLHGAGERGDDLGLVSVHGPPKLHDEVPELQGCVLVAPQCPEGGWWTPGPLLALIDEVCARADIDRERLYVTGLSMGGYGTWGLLAAEPDLFAAAVPICGGGDIGRLWPEMAVGFVLDDLLRAQSVPIRAFHGEDDDVVPVGESRLLVDALDAVGGHVELTVYPGVGHDSWTQTYADPSLYAWLFAQRRGGGARPQDG